MWWECGWEGDGKVVGMWWEGGGNVVGMWWEGGGKVVGRLDLASQTCTPGLVAADLGCFSPDLPHGFQSLRQISADCGRSRLLAADLGCHYL
jgi:hypothetical protein